MGGGGSPTSPSSEIVEETADTQAVIVQIPKPKNIQSKNLFYNMYLTWDYNSDIESYEVSYRIDDTETWKPIILKERTSREISYGLRALSLAKLMSDTLYHFRIRAKDSHGNYSDYSEYSKETLKDTTDKAVILVHGLNSGASTWDLLAPKLSKVMGVKDNTYVEIAVNIDINKSSECWDAKLEDEKIKCEELSDIDKQEPFRKVFSDSGSTIFGLDKENFDVSTIKWKLNSYDDSNATEYTFAKFDNYGKQRVFAINFSNNNQLTYDAQGYELAEIINDIKKITGISKFDIIGHSMGGLATRAYIQNEKTEHIGQYISVDTPHLGSSLGGKYIGSSKGGRNASVNLAVDSKALKVLNSEDSISNKYDDVKVYHLGYSDGLEGILDGGSYYDEGDGIVSIGSQMGLEALNPKRVIFSPTVRNTIKEYKDGVTGFSKSVDMVIESVNYDLEINFDNAHTMILKDKDCINTLVGIIQNEELTEEPSPVYTTANITIVNNTDHSISQLYIKDENSDEWGNDLVTGLDNIGEGEDKVFTTLECDKDIDIKSASIFGSKEMKIFSEYVECGKAYSLEFK